MIYHFEGRDYRSFLHLFYGRPDVPLSQLPSPPSICYLPGRSRPPLGYLCEGNGESKRFVRDPRRAPLVAEAFALIARGRYWKDAWRKLVAKGLTGRSGNGVSASGLIHALTNPAYMGLLRYGGELYAAPFDPLVSDETFRSTQRELNRQAREFQTGRLARLPPHHREDLRQRHFPGI